MKKETSIQLDEEKQKKISIYLTLAVCAVALILGIWSAISGTKSVEQDIAKNQTTTPTTTVTTTVVAVEQKVTNATKKATEKVEIATKKNTTASFFVMPVADETIKKFSAAELQFSKTYNDWRLHTGIDIRAVDGAVVKSSGDGKINKIYEDTMYGKVVEIDHGNKIVIRYCGLSTITAQEGDVVQSGEEIGKIGTVPCESKDGTHLHMEATQNGKFIDPLKLIEAE